ncbi:MAG: ParB N-terminal domain-containing protein, partial [Desulfatiglandales bacterium]|nr:ParB N-terminal domain-containing protein [Desulfatiglandales bacterium]
MSGSLFMDFQQAIGKIPVILNLKDLDENPGPFCMSFGFDLRPLIRSIEKYGLINTPIVTSNSDGSPDVVAGYRRILALKALKMEKIPCRDLSNSELSPLELLLFSLYDNLATREFNEVEMGMIFNRLMPFVSRKETREHYMPLLNLPSHDPTLDIFLKLEELDLSIRVSLVEKRIS